MPLAHWMQFYSRSLSASGWQKHTLSSVVFLSDSYPARTAPISLQAGTLGSLLKFNITWGSCCSVMAFCYHSFPGFSKQVLTHSYSSRELQHAALPPCWSASPSALRHGASLVHMACALCWAICRCWTRPQGKLSLWHTLTKSKVTEMQKLLAQ